GSAHRPRIQQHSAGSGNGTDFSAEYPGSDRHSADRRDAIGHRPVNRRAFVLASGAALMAAPASGEIVDTHIHLYDPTRPQGVPWPPKNDALLYKTVLPEHYAKLVRPLGVTRTVVVEASAWLEDNQWILDLAKEHPMIAGFVGHLEPGKPE